MDAMTARERGLHGFAHLDDSTPEACICGAAFVDGYHLDVVKRAHLDAFRTDTDETENPMPSTDDAPTFTDHNGDVWRLRFYDFGDPERDALFAVVDEDEDAAYVLPTDAPQTLGTLVAAVVAFYAEYGTDEDREAVADLAQRARRLDVGDRFVRTDDRSYTDEAGRSGTHHTEVEYEVTSTDVNGFEANAVRVVAESGRPDFVNSFDPVGTSVAWFGWEAALTRGSDRPI